MLRAFLDFMKAMDKTSDEEPNLQNFLNDYMRKANNNEKQ